MCVKLLKPKTNYKIMKKIIFMAAALLLAGSAATAQTIQAPQYEDAIQVSGQAEKKVTPDEIYVAITVRTGDVKGQSVDQIESTMKSKFKALGIDIEKNLRVTSMANAPKKKTDVDTKRSYELKVGDVWTLNSVFTTLGDMGVADANVTRVSNSKMSEYRKEVRVEAVKNARENAETLAAALGQSMGPAVWIFDGGNVYENSPVPMLMKTRMSSDSAYGAGTAEQGLDMQDITLTYNVTAKFILNRK